MKDYKLVISLKVKFFNFFRRVFTYSFFEKLLLNIILTSSASIWRKLIPPNYLYPKPSYRNCFRYNRSFLLDISTVYEHFVYYGYLEKHFNLVRQYFTANMTIFDVGANIGAAALYFDTYADNCTIHAFEPSPETFLKARQNFALNKQARITLNKIGLGDRITEHNLYQVNERNPGMNRILPELNNPEFEAYKIRLDTLDNYFITQGIEELSLIKIDVEGFEMKVIQGGLITIKRYHPIILIEVVDENLKQVENSASELIELLFNLDYLVFRVDEMREVTTNALLENCHFDALCLPKGLKLPEID